MAQTIPLTTDELGIRLDGGKTEYAPGDTLMGYVFRKAAIESLQASLSISLHGRTECKFVFRGDEGLTTYQESWDLIPSANYTQKLFEGPISMATGANELRWPFAITLPFYVDPKCVEGRRDAETFVPLVNANVDDSDADAEAGATAGAGAGEQDEADANPPDHALPSSLTLDDKVFEGFIEYRLQAELKMSTGGGDGDVKTVEAKLPFTVANPNPEDPNDGFVMETAGDSFEIKSFRLVPGKENQKLGLRKRMKTKFRFLSTTIPCFRFEMQIDVPNEIQLDGPDPISFKLGFTPDWENTSEALRGAPQTAKLTKLALRVSTATEIICKGTTEGSYIHRGSVVDTDLLVWEALQELQGPRGKDFLMPGSGQSEVVDIGQLINLRVGPYGRIVPNALKKNEGTPPLKPSFATYNIRRRHELTWVVSGTVADRDFYTDGRQTVVLTPRRDGTTS